MVHAVGARTQGDDYQARVFWINACRLLMPNSRVIRVAYENTETQFFDDVAVFYDCEYAIERGGYCTSDHYQIKFHVDHAGKFTYESFTDPAFLGVKQKSLLQRVHEFVGTQKNPCRVYVVAPWGIQDNDPLAKLVSNTGGEIRLRQLLSADAPMRRVREHWAGHLNLSDQDALVRSLTPLRMAINHFTLEGLRSKLNFALYGVGLKTFDESQHHNPYDDLIRKLQQQGKTSFTKEELIELCKKEGLWVGPKQQESGTRIGIRSFVRWAEHIEDEAAMLLSLDHLFDEREILDENSWNKAIPKKLTEFVNKLSSKASYELRLDAHSSLAFAAGQFLNPKRGIDIGIVQRILGREVVWKPSLDAAAAKAEDVWKVESSIVRESGNDIALVLNISQNATADVLSVADKIAEIGRVQTLTVLPAVGPTAVKDANHCLQLAQGVSAIVKQRSGNERNGVLHIFAAAPNAFMFMLGQLSQGFGPTMLYEYDFDSNALGAYKPSIRFPIAKDV
jgi:SMODS-associated and fused to various effectors sensor domain